MELKLHSVMSELKCDIVTARFIIKNQRKLIDVLNQGRFILSVWCLDDIRGCDKDMVKRRNESTDSVLTEKEILEVRTELLDIDANFGISNETIELMIDKIKDERSPK